MDEILIIIGTLVIIFLISYIESLRNERESLREELRQRGLGRYLYNPETG